LIFRIRRLTNAEISITYAYSYVKDRVHTFKQKNRLWGGSRLHAQAYWPFRLKEKIGFFRFVYT
jgi:hypothetical protein